MLYSQEELPESVFKSLLSAPHAKKVFTSAYEETWKQYASSSPYADDAKRNQAAVTQAWKAVREAYGI